MKIAIIAEKFQPHGGLERRAWELVRRLKDEGFKITVFAGIKGTPIEGIELKKFKVRNRPVSLSPLFSFMETAKVINGIRDEYDVIQSFMRLTPGCDIFVSGTGSHSGFAKQIGFFPFFKRLSFYMSLYNRISSYLERKILEDGLCKVVILNSELAMKQIIEICKPERLKSELEVIRNWVNLEHFSDKLRRNIRRRSREMLGLNKEFVILFSAGSKFIREGFIWLVKGLKELRGTPEWSKYILVIAGRKLGGYYKALLKSIEDKVIILGHQDDIRPIYSACDLFIRPSIYNTFSTSCAEAMAMGIPVAISEFNGVSEIVDDGKNGFVIEKPYNAELFAEKIKEIMKSDLESTGNEARKTAEKYLSLNDAVEKFKNLYGKIVE
jgi:glycosyltransferase involved in cell wall biosynthesis